MNDRFKFRAWDKRSEKIYSIAELNFRFWNDNELSSISLVQEQKEDWLLGNPINTILMQCTGLKDKNGKLIYEGDIVRYTEYEIDDIEPEWEQTEIVWGGNHYYPAFDLKQHEFECNGLAYIFNEGWTIEVVGNIYENKELLDERN